MHLFRTIKEWLHWGCEAEADFTLKRKILSVNVVALIGMLSFLAYIFFYWLSMNAALECLAGMTVLFFVLLAGVPWLNRGGHNGAARWLLVAALMGSQLSASLLVYGSFFNSYYYYILFAMAVPIVFPIRSWLLILVVFISNLGLFFLFRYSQFEPDPVLLELDSSTLELLSASYIFLSYLTLFIAVWFVELMAAGNERKLDKLSLTDALTNIPNRRYFEIALQQEIAKAQRNNTPLVLAILDIDFFKKVNDQYGHDVGDEVIKHIANHLRQVLRAGNTVARVGGEEFAVLLPEMNLQFAVEVAERMRQTIELNDYQMEDESLHLTISIGMVGVDVNESPENAYKLADDALYAAKRGGRNRVIALGE